MNILVLGEECSRLEKTLCDQGHRVYRTDRAVDKIFLSAGNFDFCVCLGYRHEHGILETTFPDGRLFNLHLGYWPYNCGAHPVFWSFYEDTPRGVTLFRIVGGTAEPILRQIADIDVRTSTLKAARAQLLSVGEAMLTAHICEFLSQPCPPLICMEKGTSHDTHALMPHIFFLEQDWGDTPVQKLLPGLRSLTCSDTTLPGLYLRSVRPEDEIFILELVNTPAINCMGLSRRRIPVEEHAQWFAERLSSNKPFFIVVMRGKPCGYVRLNCGEGTAEVSVVIAPEMQQQGIGTVALRIAIREIIKKGMIMRLIAWIRPKNINSQKIFIKANFVACGCHTINGEEMLCFQYPGYEE